MKGGMDEEMEGMRHGGRDGERDGGRKSTLDESSG